MSGTIYADLRCLQDYDYRVRGIGRHVAALLRARRQNALSDWKLVGLLDTDRPELPHEFASLVEEVSYSLNPCVRDTTAIFIDGTPMTHDPRFALRFQNHPAFFRAAILYDFIPLDWPGYLPTVASRIDYLSKLARLKAFDLFFPISRYTAWRLSELLAVAESRIHVTGASVRHPLYELREGLRIAPSPNGGAKEPYFVMLTATDSRKNPEVAVQALRRLNRFYGRRIPLKIVGHYVYTDAYKLSLFQLAGHDEGAGFLEFCPYVPDEELVSLYAGAIATIVPSHIEGFSLPVVEASVCGCPVVASTCAAHLELIDQTEALFPSYNSDALADKLEALLNDASLRARLVTAQAHLGVEFHEDSVGRRFWSALSTAVENRQALSAPPSLRVGKKPRIAFLTPFPPDQSGAARYTAMAMQAGSELFDAHLYTDAARPLEASGKFRDCGSISPAPLIAGTYDAIVSVLGNSHFHTRIFEIFERYGGPCILHDSRLIQIYIARLGHERFLQLASRLIGRAVSIEEVHSWLYDRNPVSLLLEPVVERASPLIVHTVTQQAEVKRRYGIDAQMIPSCPTVAFRDDELTTGAKQAVRERHGVPSGAFLVSSFGFVAPEKGMDTLIFAIDILRSWNVPAELYFIGSASTHKGEVGRLSALCGIAEHVHTIDDFVDDATYRDFLVASDVAAQLRTYAFGQLSAALTDCISAGLSSVASADLAKSCDSPEYVSTVPDQFSPLLVAEQLAAIWEARTERERVSHREARIAYLQIHNFKSYAKRLTEILGVA